MKENIRLNSLLNNLLLLIRSTYMSSSKIKIKSRKNKIKKLLSDGSSHLPCIRDIAYTYFEGICSQNTHGLNKIHRDEFSSLLKV